MDLIFSQVSVIIHVIVSTTKIHSHMIWTILQFGFDAAGNLYRNK